MISVYGNARHGQARSGEAMRGMVSIVVLNSEDGIFKESRRVGRVREWHGAVRRVRAWAGSAWHGEAWVFHFRMQK